MPIYGVKVSRPDKDALTENPKDALIDSVYPFLKIKLQGTISLDITGQGDFKAAITHGLGYPPAFLFYGETNPSTPGARYPGEFAATGAGGDISTDAAITNTALILGWQDTSAAPGSFETYPYKVNFYYYIFEERLNL